MFREIFDFEENDRSRKEMKRDYREMEESHRGVVKFKHLIGRWRYFVWLDIDYYLTSSEDFGHALKDIDARNVLDAITVPLTESEQEEDINEDAAR